MGNFYFSDLLLCCYYTCKFTTSILIAYFTHDDEISFVILPICWRKKKKANAHILATVQDKA